LLSTTSSLSLFPYTLPLTPKSTLFPYTTLFRSAIKAQYFKNGIANFITNGEHIATAVAEPIRVGDMGSKAQAHRIYSVDGKSTRSEEHTSELQSRFDLVCRLLLEKKKNN